MLDTLPPEILYQIAHHLILSSCRPPVDLLCTCRTLHAAAAPDLNPNLYASVFHAHYDTAAAQRRLTSLGPSDSPYPNRPRDPSSSARQLTPEPLKPADFVAELQTRTLALERLHKVAAEGRDPRAEELWVVYLMLIENDVKNLRHLVKPFGPGPSVDILALVRDYHDRTLISTNGFRYPPQRPVDALAMWISWLLDDYATRIPSRLRALRPYVFAAHQYDLFYAPWTQPRVPVPQRNNQHRAPPPIGPYTSVHMPQNHACIVPVYGRTLSIAPPILAHAAQLRFFTAPEADSPSTFPGLGPSEPLNMEDLRTHPRPTLQSARHDADFERLLACTDGSQSPGRALWAWRGVFDGCWEGTFTFLDYGAFRDMLANHPAAIYSGPYGEQAQVWKLRETFVRPKPGTPVDGPGLPLRGSMVNAGFPDDVRPFNPNAIAARAPGHSPEDATIDDALERQLAALPGYESIPPDEVETALARAEPGDNLGLLVTGVGHSAWGRFVISGHVRVWDGLLYLVKEYAPFQRGKWLYRGYVLGDGAMVGRWRDTFTPEDYVGYEGTFMLKKRS
ncbi:hypothetical protein CcaverHIS002_0109680 [Cutaneotrichosporon cavernicola]|uniref:F-box domain-containing protein n=1 Tax=Cutaneotrichosporon cavernicola TaxID=279322 RepID=A0AA48I289_9TREE|nr:uncharacterized protein CcaverHIS019_0109620 [Cutaneotrichosporon cavernicola]BEI80439.1 hypothetical protein CcaverHIS002_0109680 [Cutaneotrichosporon cavernicola]BEI88244.1 hypothetical protein CcaverHIS019_0109620 [Cutaneotrichosporon cavernicola]BEI96015.1 hypothetical protein CcaverHIS631_0109640 [Cutaneotrichosporon cavernicola]BEJ03789.1 hypothetical protein CcaverHIS641_0109640 [Cutaneotrichosporon cavernicola]